MTTNKLAHDRDFFYKYVSLNAALRILEDLSCKWSSPLILNDPFDLQVNFYSNLDPQEISELLLKEHTKMIFGEEEPVGEEEHRFFNMIKKSRQNRHRTSKNAFKKKMALVPKQTEKIFYQQSKIINTIWHTFVQNLRVFCVAEEHDNLLMWAHYADSHKGAAIKFKCLPQFDTPLCAAVQVKYQENIPIIANKEEYIKHLTGQRILNYDDLFRRFVTTKSIHWEHEKEWRCIGLKRVDDDELFRFNKLITPKEIDSVYFGCKVTEKHKKEIIEHITDDLSHVKLYQGSTDKKRYGLVFKRIK